MFAVCNRQRVAGPGRDSRRLSGRRTGAPVLGEDVDLPVGAIQVGVVHAVLEPVAELGDGNGPSFSSGAVVVRLSMLPVLLMLCRAADAGWAVLGRAGRRRLRAPVRVLACGRCPQPCQR